MADEDEKWKESVDRATRPLPFAPVNPDKLLEGIRNIQQAQQTQEKQAQSGRAKQTTVPQKTTSGRDRHPTERGTGLIAGFDGSGSTPTRKLFWNQVANTVNASRKLEGKNVVVTEDYGHGSLIDVTPQRGGGGPTPPPPIVCDGSVTVSATITASNQNGTCPSHIAITTIDPGSVSGDYVFNSEVAIDTTICCTFGSGTMEVTNGLLHCVCVTDSSTDDRSMFLSLRLVTVITAGDIYGVPYNVGDWVLLIGGTYLITGIGVCSFCISSHASAWLVFPTITNTITIVDAGVSVDLGLTFTY